MPLEDANSNSSQITPGRWRCAQLPFLVFCVIRLALGGCGLDVFDLNGFVCFLLSLFTSWCVYFPLLEYLCDYFFPHLVIPFFPWYFKRIFELWIFIRNLSVLDVFVYSCIVHCFLRRLLIPFINLIHLGRLTWSTYHTLLIHGLTHSIFLNYSLLTYQLSTPRNMHHARPWLALSVACFIHAYIYFVLLHSPCIS